VNLVFQLSLGLLHCIRVHVVVVVVVFVVVAIHYQDVIGSGSVGFILCKMIVHCKWTEIKYSSIASLIIPVPVSSCRVGFRISFYLIRRADGVATRDAILSLSE